MTLITSADITVPVTVQTRTDLSPEDAFRVIVPVDLSLVFKGWGPFPGVRGANNQTGAWDAPGNPGTPFSVTGPPPSNASPSTQPRTPSPTRSPTSRTP